MIEKAINPNNMRPIKFRCWDGEKMYHFTFKEMCEPEFFGKPENIMQFTGLLDKNRREIYEGDVLEYDWDTIKKHRAEVTFMDGSFMVGDEINRHFPAKHLREVIGNIYENPELLE